MDLSLERGTTFPSKSENSKKSLSKHDLFFESYHPYQPWALSDSIIYYIAKNPASSKIYEKLKKSCKYFFITNPILVVPRFIVNYESNKWKAYFKGKVFDLKFISSKIWVAEIFHCYNSFDNIDDQYFANSILPKIYQSDINDVTICDQDLAFIDFSRLASKCISIWLVRSAVKNDDGSIVSFTKLIEAFQSVKYFRFSHRTLMSSITTSKTVEELLKIPHFSNLVCFELSYIPESYDIETFYSYIKKNKKTKISLDFAQNISQQYKNRLQIIVNEILYAEYRNYKLPCIFFSGIVPSSYSKLYNLFWRR